MRRTHGATAVRRAGTGQRQMLQQVYEIWEEVQETQTEMACFPTVCYRVLACVDVVLRSTGARGAFFGTVRG